MSIDPAQFAELINAVNGIKEKVAVDPDKAKEKDQREKNLSEVTIFITIVSFFFSVYAIIHAANIEQSQTETQGYNFWSEYLKLSIANSKEANGLERIDGIPVADFAARFRTHINYKPAAVDTFVHYAWYVETSLAYAEAVLLSLKNDTAWVGSVDAMLRKHRPYLRSPDFNKSPYDPLLVKEIEKVIK